jgi:aminoglycoside phosphotransferase (APT) family kinase protein
LSWSHATGITARSAIWLHADLHPANVLTADGALRGVIDFGDLRVGDPALDLAAGWILLPTDVVDRVLAAYRPAAYGADSASGPQYTDNSKKRCVRAVRELACVLKHRFPGLLSLNNSNRHPC